MEGKAKAFLIPLGPASKTTYALAAAALRQRFLVRAEAGGDEWAAKARAAAEMHSLEQGVMTSDEYIDKSNDLFSILEEEYSSYQVYGRNPRSNYSSHGGLPGR